MPKIRACFKCKEYIVIFDDHPASQALENAFLNFHPKHPTQIINDDATFYFLKEAGYSEFKLRYGDVE